MTAAPARKLRAPVEDRGLLVNPLPQQLGEHIAQNESTRAAFDADFLGQSYAQLVQLGRQEVFAEAIQYTRGYRDVDLRTAESTGRFLLAGHQPELFHPGVWTKTFALDQLAQSHNAVPIHLLIDGDLASEPKLAVPTGSLDAPRLEPVAFDQSGPRRPYEDSSILDPSCFESFGRRATETLAPLVPNPLLPELWPDVVARGHATGNRGLAIAQARHRLEGAWGVETLELPQSRVCETKCFRWFTAHLLANLPRFWDVYNEGLIEYRLRYRLRSASHPAPPLAEVEGWLEAPFWVWTRDAPTRRGLLVRRQGDTMTLSNGADWRCELSLSPESGGEDAVAQLEALSAQGVRLRSRALMTTLFSRMFLCDLFVHGIGGAKYDRFTDLLLTRFFDFTPPNYATVTATMRLPLDLPPFDATSIRETTRGLRELQHHPECYLGPGVAESAEVRDLVGGKQKWIETEQTKQNARVRCRAIRAANAALQPWVESTRKQLHSRREALRQQQEIERVLGSREHPFCLFPESLVRSFLTTDLPQMLAR